MCIPSNAKIQQIADCLLGAIYRDHSLQRYTPQHLRDLKIQEVGRV